MDFLDDSCCSDGLALFMVMTHDNVVLVDPQASTLSNCLNPSIFMGFHNPRGADRMFVRSTHTKIRTLRRFWLRKTAKQSSTGISTDSIKPP